MSDSDDDNFEYANLSDSFSDESDGSESEDNDNENLDKARNWYQISINQPNVAPPRFRFEANPGCCFTLTDYDDALSYFELFFDNSLMDIILTETNRYAFQHPGSSQNLWSPITMEELYIFLAITILQGIIRKPEIRMYWSKVEIFQSPIFSEAP